MHTLILTPRGLSDAQALATAAHAIGWEVVRLTSWRVPPDLRLVRPVVYGEPLFAEVVAAELDLVLLQAPADWLAQLPARWRLRWVQCIIFGEACTLPGPVFAKPADEKSFPARVYAAGADIPL
jgi:hypothetical protein